MGIGLVIMGAGGHAKEILQHILNHSEVNSSYQLAIFDDLNENVDSYFKDCKHLKNDNDLMTWFQVVDSKFILGLGTPENRSLMYSKGINLGGQYVNSASCDVLSNTFIGPSVKMKKGCLINTFASIHHDVVLGEFVEIAPRATLLGGCSVGDKSFIGASATILPNIKVGANCVVGAGALVCKDVPDNQIVKGVPAL